MYLCMNTHSLLRVTGHMYLICAGSGMAGQRGPLQACGPGYQALPPPWYAIPTRKTCFSDITARTIWNIPLDHLHLMWRQVHNKAVQVFFCLSLTHGTHRQSPFSTVEQALFAFLISTFLSKKKNGADAESLNSRKTLTTNHMAFPTRSSSPRASSRLNLILLPETIFDHTSVDSSFKDYSYKPANPHQCLPLTGLLPTKIL